MKAQVIQIGNSRGIRIPKALLELCHIRSQVEIQVRGTRLLIEPAKHNPRSGWVEAFQIMHARGDDAPLIDDRLDLDGIEWEW